VRNHPRLLLFGLSVIVLWSTYIITLVLVPYLVDPSPLYPLYYSYSYISSLHFLGNIFDPSSLDFWMVILGSLIICISAIFKKWRIAVSVVFGYLYGIVLAVTGSTWTWSEGPGMYQENSWQLFVSTFIVCIVVGLIWQAITNRLKVWRSRKLFVA